MFKYLGVFTELAKALVYMEGLQDDGKKIRIENLPVLGIDKLEWVYVLSEEV